MSRYSQIKIIQDSKENYGASFYSTAKYPKIPLSENDIYVLTEETDRLDLLASQFYGDPSLWWVISIANEQLSQSSLLLPAGMQLRIPVNVSQVTNLYNKLNR